MDDQTYQFYTFNYEDFKNDNKINSKLDYEAIVGKVKIIRNYFQVFNNVSVDEKLAKFKVFYACKLLFNYKNLKDFCCCFFF
jgi:hypothetical protein